MKLHKLLNSKSTLLASIELLLIVAAVLLIALWIGIITHRSSYLATGAIAVSPADKPSKYYTLKVGDQSAEVTDSMQIRTVASHWYSITAHQEYEISAASWSNGDKLTFRDAGCTVPNKNTRKYCVADDGRGYYVGVVSVGPSLTARGTPSSKTSL